MKKIFLDKEQIKKGEKKYHLQQIHDFLQENNHSYVLITCSKPNDKGEMQVDLNYGGEKDVAQYLLESSIGVFQEEDKQTCDK